MAQLRLIRWAKGLGFTLREIREMTGAVGQHADGRGDLVRSQVRAKISEVDAKMSQLAAIRAQLAGLAKCHCKSQCPVIKKVLTGAPPKQSSDMMLSPLLFTLAATAPAARTPSVQHPIACRTNALDKDQRKRQQALLETVRRAAVGTEDLPDGVALSFPADPALVIQVAEWMGLERRCCPFLAFALDWNQDDRVSVRITGQPGAKEAIAAEMGISASR